MNMSETVFEMNVDMTGAVLMGEFAAVELADILRSTADSIENGMTEVYIRDSNGNTVGFASLKDVPFKDFDEGADY